LYMGKLKPRSANLPILQEEIEAQICRKLKPKSARFCKLYQILKPTMSVQCDLNGFSRTFKENFVFFHNHVTVTFSRPQFCFFIFSKMKFQPTESDRACRIEQIWASISCRFGLQSPLVKSADLQIWASISPCTIGPATGLRKPKYWTY